MSSSFWPFLNIFISKTETSKTAQLAAHRIGQVHTRFDFSLFVGHTYAHWCAKLKKVQKKACEVAFFGSSKWPKWPFWTNIFDSGEQMIRPETLYTWFSGLLHTDGPAHHDKVEFFHFVALPYWPFWWHMVLSLNGVQLRFLLNAKPPFMFWRRSVFNEVIDWPLS